MARSHHGGTTIAITNLLSQSPPQFIDTGVEPIDGLALTGNVLLVIAEDFQDITAWKLTEEGVVVGQGLAVVTVSGLYRVW